ncbi:MAG: AAA family ATPase [Saprospiraceae bacterium]|jgi:MoxR-like ATPase
MEKDHPANQHPDELPGTENPTAEGSEVPRQPLDLSHLKSSVDSIKGEISKVIVGQENFIELLLAALFTGGHALVEGVPGIAKTLTAKLLAQTLDIDFSRIQFTPDLMPSDVVGTNVFNPKTSEFSFNPGPIFANIVLIDEINRSPAKTQAALFEVMEEVQVTIDGRTYPMDFPFFVVATQNPIEQEGTYKLPEAQLDRFLMKIEVVYPNLEEEKEILLRFQNDFGLSLRKQVLRVLGPAELAHCRELIEQVHLSVPLIEYIAAIVHRTRSHGDVYLGASPRASLAILKTSKALAAMQGRDFVVPEDIQTVAYPVLIHRIILQPEREIEGHEPRDVIRDILEKLEVPR